MKIIAGNWKMNGNADMLREMCERLSGLETENTIVICPPFTLLGAAAEKRPGNPSIGVQDVSAHESGAYTGEVSAKMAAAAGAAYAIVGHSERRQYHGETNDAVRQKAERALSAGLTPIICVGETMAEKESGKMMEVIESQVRECVPSSGGDVVVAYEPRWAIGAGLTPTNEEIAAAHGRLAEVLAASGRAGAPILYGASVKGANAAEIMSIPNVGGVLVGGASLKPDDFIPIIMA
jgi:triosephosphate isomerase